MKISVVNWLKILCLTNFSDCFDIVIPLAQFFQINLHFDRHHAMQIRIFISLPMSNAWTATLARPPGPFVPGSKSTTVHNSHLSTTAIPLQQPFFGGQSIHPLLFKPVYNNHFLLSPRWPVLFPHVVSASSMKKYPDKTTF